MRAEAPSAEQEDEILLRALPLNARVDGIINVDVPHDRPPVPRLDELQWINQRGPDRIIAALRAQHLPAEPGIAYVAGEARDCQSVRRHLTAERGPAPQ
jgi:NADPH-dependent ferric siderophore reductase